MGVRGLMSFLEHCCPGGSSEVQISTLIENYRESNGRRPEIVVDAHACYNVLCEDQDWSIGLEPTKLLHSLRRFVAAFQNKGADLVFFFDGLTPRKKRDTWLKRRVELLGNMVTRFNWLGSDTPIEEFPDDLTYIPPNVSIFIAFALKHILNCKVFVTIRECDEEIIEYVFNNGNPFIFSFDSDFIISNINASVLSASKDHFNLETMTTRLLDRRALMEHLGLRLDQLPLLAILIGNDIIDPRLLIYFHHRLTGLTWNSVPFERLIGPLVRFISNLPQHVSPNKLMQIVCFHIFFNRVNTSFLRMAHRAYFPNLRRAFPEIDGPWSQVLDTAKTLMRNAQLPVPVWAVLSAYIYESNPFLEDLRVTNNSQPNARSWPCARITRPLRRRWYGVLLFERRDVDRLVVEWCAESLRSYVRPKLVRPNYPLVDHPGLLRLWSQDLDPILHLHQWTLFLNIVSPNITDLQAWMGLRKDLVMPTAVCHYLCEEGFLVLNELHAVLVTFAMYPHCDWTYLNGLPRGPTDSRVRQISITVSRTYSLVFYSFAACGYPHRLCAEIAHIKFEPALLQAIFNRAQAGAAILNLCDGNMDAAAACQEMKNVIDQSCDWNPLAQAI